MARSDDRKRHKTDPYTSRAQSDPAANRGTGDAMGGTGMRRAGNRVSHHWRLGGQGTGDGRLALEGESRAFSGDRRSRYGAAASSAFRGAEDCRKTVWPKVGGRAG